MPTNIGLSYNVEITAQTTRNHSLERLKRELRLVSVERKSQPTLTPLWRRPPTYFPLSLPLLARLLGFIICKNEGMSSAGDSGQEFALDKLEQLFYIREVGPFICIQEIIK